MPRPKVTPVRRECTNALSAAAAAFWSDLQNIWRAAAARLHASARRSLRRRSHSMAASMPSSSHLDLGSRDDSSVGREGDIGRHVGEIEEGGWPPEAGHGGIVGPPRLLCGDVGAEPDAVPAAGPPYLRHPLPPLPHPHSLVTAATSSRDSPPRVRAVARLLRSATSHHVDTSNDRPHTARSRRRFIQRCGEEEE